jgi:hypothetical protein
LTTSRSEFSTSWRSTNGMTTTMQSRYPCLLTTTSHQEIRHMTKCLSAMGMRWSKWPGTCLELKPSLYEVETQLSVPYSIAQLGANGHCKNSICMLDINLMMMQHWATWWMPCIVFTPSNMFSFSGEPAKRWSP